MSFKPKFYIVFPYTLVSEISWPKGWHRCPGNVSLLIKDILKISSIGSEIKLIWNFDHRREILKNNNITDQQLDDYLKADCSLVSFQSETTMNRAVKVLKNLGSENFICLDNYRDVLIQQAYYKQNKRFFYGKK